MKPTLNRDQVVPLACAGLVVLLLLALDWWGLGALIEKSDLAQQLADRRGKSEVTDILGRSGGIEEANKEILRLNQLGSTLATEEERLMGPWRRSTAEAMGEGQEWGRDGNKWKDLLVKYNDEILEKSGRNGEKKKVNLSTNFYLGLEEFKQRSPADEEIPNLALQLSVSKHLVDLLFAAKEKTPEGYPTSCLLLKLQGPLPKAGDKPADTKPTAPNEKTEYFREKYFLEFESSPEVLLAYLGMLARDPMFFVPTDLMIQNEKETFPKRSQLAGLFARNSGEGGVPSDPARGSQELAPPPLLLVLAGKERVRVNLQLDYIGWRSPREQMPAKNK